MPKKKSAPQLAIRLDARTRRRLGALVKAMNAGPRLCPVPWTLSGVVKLALDRALPLLEEEARARR